MAKELVVAARSFKYGELQLEKGMVFELLGFKNDEGLKRHKLVTPLQEWGVTESELVQCGTCGARFTRASLLEVHGNNKHN